MNYEQKFIEIPFGAKDSKLKGWEYTIPEGMEAIVKDGKVIVREKESEDERIRREINNLYSEIETCITELLKARADKDSEAEGKARFKMEGLMVATHEELSCIEAYLEKQKEQPKEEFVYRLNGLMQKYIKDGKDEEEREHRYKCYQLFWDALEDTEFFQQKEQNVIPSRETILGIWELGNIWKENPEARDGLTQLQYIQKYWFEKSDYQKEQKHPNGCFTCDEYKKGYEAGRSNGFTAGYNKAMKEQKPVDEPFEEWIDGWYNEHHRDGYITMDEREFKNFCRGIKNIYQQKPAEWGEEDEKNLENIKIYLLHHGEDSWADTIIKLKSLRPSWKPSEEKVKPLRNVPPIESTMK